MTSCEQCRRTELTPWGRLREDLLGVLGLDAGAGARRTTIALQHHARMIAVAYGAPAKTAYDRHRDEYERTGDPVELTRMLRHVK